jgi:hypothetical protein
MDLEGLVMRIFDQSLELGIYKLCIFWVSDMIYPRRDVYGRAFEQIGAGNGRAAE